MRDPAIAGRRNSSCCSRLPRCRMIGVAMRLHQVRGDEAAAPAAADLLDDGKRREQIAAAAAEGFGVAGADEPHRSRRCEGLSRDAVDVPGRGVRRQLCLDESPRGRGARWRGGRRFRRRPAPGSHSLISKNDCSARVEDVAEGCH